MNEQLKKSIYMDAMMHKDAIIEGSGNALLTAYALDNKH